MFFEQSHQRVEPPDAILQKNRELRHAGPLKTRALFGLWRKCFFHLAHFSRATVLFPNKKIEMTESHVKQEMRNVAVFHEIRLALDAHFSRGLDGRLGFILLKIGERINFRTDKT